MTDEAHGVTRAGMARSLRDFLASYPGVAVEAMFAQVGITADLLADPQAFISHRLVVELIAVAVRETGDEALGVRYAEQMPWRDLGVLAYVALNSPTIGAMFANIGRYFAVQSNLAGTELVVEGELARVVYAIRDPAIPVYPQNTELVFALHTRICREATGDPAWAASELRLRHPAPRSTAIQQRWFRCPLHYGQAEDALVVAAAELRRPLRTADPGLLPILIAHADACLAKVPAGDDFANTVRSVVISALAAGDATVEHAAMQLGLGTRSIQRRLQATGTSFSQVVEDARRELARRYLGDPAITITEAAFLLGYSELSAFSRAFRRWTGQTAADFRRDSLGSRV